LAAARQQKAGLAINGNLEKMGNGVRLTIQVYDPDDSKLRYQKEFPSNDPRQLLVLAEQAAKDLRLKAFGESSLHSTYMPLEQITSGSPEALDCYFRAIAYYEKGEADPALALLDRALALDPGFVLGHHYRAVVLIAKDELEMAMGSEEIAFAKRHRVTDRERYWIEGEYANLIRDFKRFAAAMGQNTVLFPDEAFFQRQHAFALMRLGLYDDAISHNRRAIELDPFSDNNARELLVNLAEANLVDECMDEVNKLEAAGRPPAHIHRALAFVYLQKGEYETSLSEFHEFGNGSLERESISRLLSLAPLIMLGRFSEAIQWIISDISLPDTPKEDNYTRRSILGQLHRLQDNTNQASEQAEYLVNLPPLATNLMHLRDGCALAFDLKQAALLERGLVGLVKISKTWTSAHSESAVWLTQAMLKDLQGENGEALSAQAKLAWADPINLFYAAQWEGKTDNLMAQLADLDDLERLRGKIYKYHFAGMVVLTWLERARCLRKMSDYGEALRMYDRVQRHWGNTHTAVTLMGQVFREQNELQRGLR
jgi:tetratricopeptide (TPR) repeat protein